MSVLVSMDSQLFTVVEIRGFLKQPVKFLIGYNKMLLRYYPFMAIRHYFCTYYLDIF